MATSMTDHPAAAPPPHKGGGGGAILLGLVGLAAVGGGAWFLTHRGQSTPPSGAPPPAAGCGPCPYSNPADIYWHCVLGLPNPTPTNSADDLALSHVAWLAQTGQRSPAQINAGIIPGACSVCWDRLPTGCVNPGCS